MSPLTGPLALSPLLLDKRWGDGALLAEAGIPLEASPATGELWLASDLPGYASPIPELDTDLAALLAAHPEEVLGAALSPEGPPRLPIVIKLLTGGQRLSVQVHPDAGGARRLGVADRGKHEAWWVLAAREEALIVRGLKRRCEVEEARAAIAEGRFQELLIRYRPEADELYDIPPGTIHGCGDGLVILEVQERCDVTFRIYDWGREGTTLHLDEALSVSRFEPDGFAPGHARDGAASLARAPFAMRGAFLEAGAEVEVGEQDVVELTVVARGRVREAGSGRVFGPGATLLWPACAAPGRLIAEAPSALCLAAPRPAGAARIL